MAARLPTPCTSPASWSGASSGTPGVQAICLSDNPAVLTAWSNDYCFETVFARQVEAYGEKAPSY